MIKEFLKPFTPLFVKKMYHNMVIFKDNFYIAYHQLKRKPVKTSKTVIVFLVQRTEVWNSVKTVYEAAKKCSSVYTYIIAIPPNRGGKIILDDKSVFDFCQSISENAINSYDAANDSFFDISSLHPTYIFLNVPYTDEYPVCYKIQKLTRISRVCYVPYGYTLIEGGLQTVNLRRELLANVDFIFCESKITERYCKKNLFLTKLLGKDIVYDFGFPRFELYKNLPIRNKRVINVMWIPRWTTKNESAKGNESSSFFIFKDEIIDFFSKMEDVKLTIRPHPRAFPNYVLSGAMTQEEVDNYKNKIDNIQNIELDQSVSYYESLVDTDILIADFSSLVAEFFITGRPIIYFGSDEKFSRENKKMFSTFYNVTSWKDVHDALIELIKGDDKKKLVRKNTVEHFVNKKNIHSGSKIVGFLLKKNN